MALTTDILRANELLATLTDEQLTAITTLSQNDENSVIAKKTGEIYGGLDNDILSVTGIPKNGTEKTFDYAKRVLTDYKSQLNGISDLNAQITSLTKEKARLEKAIADGTGDAEAKRALAQAQKDLAAITTQFNTLKSEYDNAKDLHIKELYGLKVETELQSATSQIKFKAGLPESATKVLLEQAISKIKSMQSEFVDDGKGGKVLVFKDDNGAIMRNPNNQLNPYTPSDLLAKELDSIGILDTGSKGGAGTKPLTTLKGGTIAIDVSGVKTRIEAYDTIAATLMANGLTIGSADFDKAMSQAWQDNNISALPER